MFGEKIIFRRRTRVVVSYCGRGCGCGVISV